MEEDRVTHYNNKGEQDAAQGHYEPPSGGPLGFNSKQDIADIQSYNKGYENTKSQKGS